MGGSPRPPWLHWRAETTATPTTHRRNTAWYMDTFLGASLKPFKSVEEALRAAGYAVDPADQARGFA